MARVEPEVKSDIVNVVFPGSPKRYGYRYSAYQLQQLGREELKAGDHVVVKTRDGYVVVEVSSVVRKEAATDRELRMATAWIVDKVSLIQWGKLPPGEDPAPPSFQKSDDDLAELLDELL